MPDSHIRLNKVTREWVIYAPSRGKRPQDFQNQQTDRAPHQMEHDPHCPFCLGNEQEIEPSLLELPLCSHLVQSQNSPDLDSCDRVKWQTRVVLNKFPALTPTEDAHRSREGIYLSLPGYGQHEIVIESPSHTQTIATMSLAAVETVIETYHQRYLALMDDPQNMMVIIFRNHGKAAGASLRHPHSQIIATGIVTHHRRSQEDEAQRYFDEWGSCVYCDILNYEQQNPQRLIAENRSFLAFVPFAAEVPFEIWIMPIQHQPDFGCISAQEKRDFAAILKTVLGRLYKKLNNPDYNYVIDTAARFKADEPQLHWYCRIRPRLTTSAGFEIGSGISINPSLPEADAAFLNAP